MHQSQTDFIVDLFLKNPTKAFHRYEFFNTIKPDSGRIANLTARISEARKILRERYGYDITCIDQPRVKGQRRTYYFLATIFGWKPN